MLKDCQCDHNFIVAAREVLQGFEYPHARREADLAACGSVYPMNQCRSGRNEIACPGVQATAEVKYPSIGNMVEDSPDSAVGKIPLERSILRCAFARKVQSLDVAPAKISMGRTYLQERCTNAAVIARQNGQ